MDEKKLEELLRRALESQSQKPADLDIVALSKVLQEAIASDSEARAEDVKTQISAALKERDDAEEARAKAEEATKKTEEDAAAKLEELEANAESRADLIVMVRELLPEGTEVKGKSKKDLLVLAVDKEVEDADKRSEDYLLAKVEGIIERRSEASKGTPSTHRISPGIPGSGQVAGPVNLLNLPRPSKGADA